MTASDRTFSFLFRLAIVGLFLMISPHAAAVASSATFFVDSDGSDTNPGTDALPFRTISYAVSRLAPGETLLVKGGTYAESLDDNIPAGTSWSQPVTVAAYPGHTVILRPPPGAEFVLHFQGPQAYIVVDGLILDGSNVTYDVVKITERSDGIDPAHHIRLQNCEVMNSPTGHGILISGNDVGSNEILDCKIHDNGNVPDGGSDNHGMYVKSNYNLISGNEIWGHTRGYGIQLFNGTQSFNTIERNMIHDNPGGGILVNGNENLIALNLFWRQDAAIIIGSANEPIFGNWVYHNTMYQHLAGLVIQNLSSQTLVTNNIIQQSDGFPNDSIVDDGISTVIHRNLLDRGISRNHVPQPLADNLQGDARFVNPSALDFHLQASSPAIGAGMDLPEIPTDFDYNLWSSPRSVGGFR